MNRATVLYATAWAILLTLALYCSWFRWAHDGMSETQLFKALWREITGGFGVSAAALVLAFRERL
jgi:hypothetical protein